MKKVTTRKDKQEIADSWGMKVKDIDWAWVNRKLSEKNKGIK